LMMALRTALAEELQCDLKGWGRNAPSFFCMYKISGNCRKNGLHKYDSRHVVEEIR